MFERFYITSLLASIEKNFSDLADFPGMQAWIPLPFLAHPVYHSITLLENQDHLLTCQRACELEHNSYDDCLYRLCALDRATGKLLRIVKSGRVREGPTPVFFTGFRQPVVYLHTHSYPRDKRPNLFAMSKQDGREFWSTHLSYADCQGLACS